MALNPEAVKLLEKLSSFLEAKNYSHRTVRSYVSEMRYIFSYYNDVAPDSLRQDDIVNYINYIKREHGVGRDKCRMTAQACSFFYKHILPTPYVVPHALYPRKEFRLPNILSEEQIVTLLSSITNEKHKMIVALFYGSGIRLSELRFLKMSDIDSHNFRSLFGPAKVVRIVSLCFPKTCWMSCAIITANTVQKLICLKAKQKA